MSTYPNLNKDPELLKIKTKDEKTKDLKEKTQRNLIMRIY